jgi:hypothetical protein
VSGKPGELQSGVVGALPVTSRPHSVERMKAFGSIRCNRLALALIGFALAAAATPAAAPALAEDDPPIIIKGKPK